MKAKRKARVRHTAYLVFACSPEERTRLNRYLAWREIAGKPTTQSAFLRGRVFAGIRRWERAACRKWTKEDA